MEKEKSHSKIMEKELDALLSRLNALEASSDDRYQKLIIGILRTLTENQKQFIKEFDHLKKAIDLLTLQLFKAENRSSS